MENLTRKERLRGRERIGQIFEAGTRAASGKVAARGIRNDEAFTRVAAVAGKKIGNAVKRNRMRRRLRAAYRLQKEQIPAGWDVVLVARPGLAEAEWKAVLKDVLTAAARAATGPGPRRPEHRE